MSVLIDEKSNLPRPLPKELWANEFSLDEGLYSQDPVPIIKLLVDGKTKP